MRNLTLPLLLFWIAFAGGAAPLRGQLQSAPSDPAAIVRAIYFYRNTADTSQTDTLKVWAVTGQQAFYFTSPAPNIFPFSPFLHVLQYVHDSLVAQGAMDAGLFHNPAGIHMDPVLAEPQLTSTLSLAQKEGESLKGASLGVEKEGNTEIRKFSFTRGSDKWEVSYIPGCCISEIVLNGVVWKLEKINKWAFDVSKPLMYWSNICPKPAVLKLPVPPPSEGK